MASYICKCGRVVEKSTTADNTGNRDTAGCEGCPYLLPWGPDEYVAGQGFVKNVKGHECRMSPTLEYRTELHGRLDDKTTIRITSLDFDFLERVSNWVKEHYPNGELLGGFSRDRIRAVEYVDEGRYRYTLACSQNKKGIAAKRALWAEFFDETFRRKDMDADAEKQKILRDIEQGKAATQRKEDKMQTDDHGTMTDAGELLPNGTECRRHAARRARTEMGKVQAIHVCDDQPEGVKIWLNASCPAEYWVLLEAGKIEGEHVESCPYCAALLGIGCGDVLLVPFGAELKSNKLPKIPEENNEPACSCAGCKREDCICAGGHNAAGRADCTGEQNCAQSGCTYAAKHRANPPTPADADASPCAPGASDVPPSPSQSAAADAQQGANDDLPEVCRGCRCTTCGNEDCPTPCHQKSDEVEECEQLGPLGDDCEDYQPKEDAECLKTPAPNGDVAAITAANAATKPSRVAETTTTSENGADVSGFPNALTAPQPAEGCADIATNAPSSMPTFDYSGLDDQTVADLHLAEREYAGGKKMAEMGLRRMADAVAIAHDALCVTDATLCRTGGKFATSEQSFSSWCESIGIHRKAAERLLQVSKLMDNSTPREQRVLEELSPTLLYAAAKPSAPAELVQAVKDGDITTHKQYQEAMAQLKAEREARKQAEQQLADVQRANQAERESTSALLRDEQQRRQKAEEGRIAAEQEKQAAQRRADVAEKERDGARQALRGTRKQEEKWREKAQTVQAQLDQLQSQPIPSTAIDMDEVERRVAQRMEAERAKHPPEDPERSQQDSRDAYDAFILATRSIDNIWKTLRPQVGRLADLRGNAKNMLLQQLMKVKEELIHECEDRQS